jgi:hypothetical protein
MDQTAARKAGPSAIDLALLDRVENRFIRAGLLITIAWGALAFGAPYPWSYWPLIISCIALGVFAAAIAWRFAAMQWPFYVAVTLFVVGVFMQLIPFAIETLLRWSPSTVIVIRQYDLDTALGIRNSHALSIDPAKTWLGLAFFLSFAAMFVGLTKFLSLNGTRWLAEGIATVGGCVALIGIVQKPIFAGKIYGFWTPLMRGTPFGPFVNKNHFAGWMLMALPLSLGLFCGAVAKGFGTPNAGLRQRILWLGTAEANRALLLGAAAVTMAFSVVLTLSKSGIGALVLTMFLVSTLVVKRIHARSRRLAAGMLLATFVLVVAARVGATQIATRFASANWSEADDRRGAWVDAWNIAKAFPVAGTGLNTYGTATLFFQRHDLGQHYAEAHNDYLQLFAEGGWLLCVPLVLLVGVVANETVRRFRDERIDSTSWWTRAGAATGMIAIILQETVDFSLQMPGNAVLFTVLCAILVHRSEWNYPRAGRREE